MRAVATPPRTPTRTPTSRRYIIYNIQMYIIYFYIIFTVYLYYNIVILSFVQSELLLKAQAIKSLTFLDCRLTVTDRDRKLRL